MAVSPNKFFRLDDGKNQYGLNLDNYQKLLEGVGMNNLIHKDKGSDDIAYEIVN
jgi:hypothetical protein